MNLLNEHIDKWVDRLNESLEAEAYEKFHEESQDKPKSQLARERNMKPKEALEAATESVSQMKKDFNVFKVLSEVNVNENTEKKGKFTYLSWAWAVNELLKHFPTAEWEVKRFDGLPYLKTDTGYYVEVEVNINGLKRSQIHPVLDNYNKPIMKPNCFQINTSIQRCLAKAISLHGLGLYIYAGEDLPNIDKEENNLKLKYFQLLKSKYKGTIPEGIINSAKSMSKNDFTLAITNLENE